MVVSAENLEFGYHAVSVLEDISFSAERGDFVAIMGNNGAGKSTLLMCIDRMLRYRKGQILIDSTGIERYSPTQLSKKVAYVAQSKEINHCTVMDTVLLGRIPHIKWNVSKEDIAVANEIIDRMNMSKLAMRYLDELSGGEVQKVMVARALAQDPQILLLDEPTNNLDLKNQLDVLDLVHQISQEKNLAVISVLHDLNISLRYADKFIFLKNKNIVASGDQNIMTSQLLSDIYDIPIAVEQLYGRSVVIPL